MTLQTQNNRRVKASRKLSAEQGSAYESEQWFTSKLTFQYIAMGSNGDSKGIYSRAKKSFN